jgi:hypothetical protein
MPDGEKNSQEVSQEIVDFMLEAEEGLDRLGREGASEEVMDQAAADIQKGLLELVQKQHEALGAESPWLDVGEGKPEWPG